MKFFVEYNGKYVAEYKSVKSCLNYIEKKNLKDDENNLLVIICDNGDMYNYKGELIEE